MDSKEPNEQHEQQQLQPPHVTLTGSYNRNAAALRGPTSTSQATPHWLSVGALSGLQPQKPLGLYGSPSSVATQQPWMQFNAPDGIDTSLRLSLPSASDGGANYSSDPPVIRSRGRPLALGPIKTQLNALGTPFIPNVIKVEAGEGDNEIVAMSGSFSNVTEGNGNLRVSLANHNGNIVGGSVAGMLVAGSQVQVVVGSFVPQRVNLSARRVENNPEPASASASASGGGLTDGESPLHQVGNSTPQPPDQMCDLHLWPGINPQ